MALGSAAKIAGPAAIISWILGAIIIIAISLTYVELGSMFPESGGMSRYAQYSHGPLLGFIAAWANWISLVTLVPMEAVAAVNICLLALVLGKLDASFYS